MSSRLNVVGAADASLVRQALEAAALLGFDAVRRDSPEGEALTFIAHDDAKLRAEALTAVPKGQRVNLVHPSAVVSLSAQLGDNVYVGAQAVIGMAAEVGDGTVQNALSSIEHDNRIGAFAMLGTGAILCGHVTVGEFAFIGGGATVKPRSRIGARTTIGAGAVVIGDAEPDAVYVGNPARILER